jgi:hypothetical protein
LKVVLTLKSNISESVFEKSSFEKMSSALSAQFKRPFQTVSEDGFVYAGPKEAKSVHGFQTGDIVKAILASGKSYRVAFKDVIFSDAEASSAAKMYVYEIGMEERNASISWYLCGVCSSAHKWPIQYHNSKRNHPEH